MEDKHVVIANLNTMRSAALKADTEVTAIGEWVFLSIAVARNTGVIGLQLTPQQARDLALDLADYANEAQDIDAVPFLANVLDDGVVMIIPGDN